MKIERERYVIMRDGLTEIWCGLARNYRFFAGLMTSQIRQLRPIEVLLKLGVDVLRGLMILKS